jgi:hypothetical protein
MILFANIENMLAPDGRFILAWWLGAKRGYQEESIEEEFNRFFKLEQGETYRASPQNIIKGDHRILVGRRRISVDDEILNSISWKGARVLDLSTRGADLKERYGWLCKNWELHPAQEASASEADILITDRVTHGDLARLRPNGTVVSYDRTIESRGHRDFDNLFFVKGNEAMSLSAKTQLVETASPIATRQHPRQAGPQARSEWAQK